MAGAKPRRGVAGKNTLRILGRELVEMHYLLTNPVLMDDSVLRNLLGGIRKEGRIPQIHTLCGYAP